MSKSVPVLFIDGPLAGEWRDLPPHDDHGWFYQYVNPEPPTLADIAGWDPQATVQIGATDYAIDWVSVFDRKLWIGHAGPRDLMSAGAYRYLVHPDVQAKLEALGG